LGGFSPCWIVGEVSEREEALLFCFPLVVSTHIFSFMTHTYIVSIFYMLDTKHHLLQYTQVYKRLQEVGIPVPRHIVVNRAAPDFADPPGFAETEDYVEVREASQYYVYGAIIACQHVVYMS
jgi:hypothetical protein